MSDDPLSFVAAWTVRALAVIFLLSFLVRHLFVVIRATARAIETFLRSLYERK